MPYSSGGSSHSGGSFHGSSSSGGSSSPQIHTRSTYFKGCRTYVYCRRGSLRYIYADGDLAHQSAGGKVLTIFILALFTIICTVLTILTLVPPSKLKGTDDFEIVIQDTAHVIPDDTKLRESLQEFKNLTGIVPAVYTAYNDEWINNYTAIDVYAKDVYVNLFYIDGEEDENHWLIVYTLPEPEDINDGFVKWYFVGMQGYNTSDILTESKTTEYIETMDSYFRINRFDPGTSLTYAFNSINKTVMDGGHFVDALPQMCIAILMLIFLLAFILGDKFKGYKTKELVEVKTKDGKPTEGNCEYCGGLYVVGTHTSCPHCGAAIPAEDITEIKDKEEDIVKDIFDASEKQGY